MGILGRASKEITSIFPSAQVLVLFQPHKDLGLPAPYAWEVLDAAGNVLATRGSWAETEAIRAFALSVSRQNNVTRWLHVQLR